jgi:cellulose/xylan binding protein with CBM9 domain
MKKLSVLLFLLAIAPAWAQVQKPTFESIEAAKDVKLTLDPTDVFWRAARPVYLQVNRRGQAEMDYRTEVRSRWTKAAIYFLFSCPYKQLYVKPDPDTSRETYELWNWNVAEVFLGSDFKDIKRYKEFEVSPQNEWIDLDVDLHKPHHEEGWVWNSNFEHRARVDTERHTWYVAMKIAFAAFETPSPQAGQIFRVNLFRTEGPQDHIVEVLWQPTMSETFHVPEKFGLLKLVPK